MLVNNTQIDNYKKLKVLYDNKATPTTQPESVDVVKQLRNVVNRTVEFYARKIIQNPKRNSVKTITHFGAWRSVGEKKHRFKNCTSTDRHGPNCPQLSLRFSQ